LAALLDERKFIGSELKDEYYDITLDRIRKAMRGEVNIREDVPVIEPDLNTAVAKLPEEFREARKNK
ncbi:MAG: site-specific DNA-methyltransferase, partial [Clostridia bacterium]|nr:site-specific DNA-methyltransferase [Clostridia bacterium]